MPERILYESIYHVVIAFSANQNSCFLMAKNSSKYSRTSVARTLVARLPRLFGTRS